VIRPNALDTLRYVFGVFHPVDAGSFVNFLHECRVRQAGHEAVRAAGDLERDVLEPGRTAEPDRVLTASRPRHEASVRTPGAGLDLGRWRLQ
jgi:hypothetical protein